MAALALVQAAMTEHPLQFLPRPHNSPAVLARLAVVGDIAQRRAERIDARNQPYKREFERIGNAILDADLPVAPKIMALWALADAMFARTGDDVACKRGCAHCCHIAVGVLSPEAEVIGKLIGRAPALVASRSDFVGFDYGYHNPCTFLKNGECSIYAHRPLACRVQFSVDVDDLLCRLTPPHSVSVPYLDHTQLQMAMVQVCMQGNMPKLADIREYFPVSS